MFVNYLSNKGLVSRIHKGLSKLDSNKGNNSIRIWTKDMKSHFLEEDIFTTKKPMKRCSTLMATREMQIKTTMRFHYTPIRMVKIKNSENTKCWRRCRKPGSFIHI